MAVLDNANRAQAHWILWCLGVIGGTLLGFFIGKSNPVNHPLIALPLVVCGMIVLVMSLLLFLDILND